MSKVANYEPPPQYTPAKANVESSNPSMKVNAKDLLPNQPTLPVVWMRAPPPMSNCSPGLEYLASLDKVLIEQEISQADDITGSEKNRYIIRNSLNEQIYIACENPTVDESTNENRAFIIHLFDRNNREILRFSRDGGGCRGCGCCICCCKSCAYEVKVETPDGQVIGYVKQRPSCCNPKFGILDAEEKLLLNIIPPTEYYENGQVDFEIRSIENGEPIGEINRFSASDGDEDEEENNNSKADNFGFNVPVDLPVQIKGTLLGAVLFIDFIYFESTPSSWQFGFNDSSSGHSSSSSRRRRRRRHREAANRRRRQAARKRRKH